jgi:hypothetical protein
MDEYGLDKKFASNCINARIKTLQDQARQANQQMQGIQQEAESAVQSGMASAAGAAAAADALRAEEALVQLKLEDEVSRLRMQVKFLDAVPQQVAGFVGAGGGAAQTNIQNNLERVPLAFSGLEVATVGMVPTSTSGKCIMSPTSYLLLAISLGNTLVLISQLESGESSAGKEKTSGVSRGIVGDTNVLGQAVFGKLVSIRGAKHLVALEVRRNNLRGDVAVAEADDHAVLRSVVLVAVLDNEATTGIVVRLAFTSPTELHLKPLEVRPGLQHFNERHLSRVLI